MPVVFELNGFKIFFFSNEGDPLEPEVHLANSFGFSAVELNKIRKIVDNRKSEIEEAWNEHFNS